ncbi:GNAT family N-acetyltransferase [Streptomyces xanthii]|uniref:GNAT family N-acetyltransferase n=1 Tax=Streptomyces xanthii TaxID=2768069 RepID=A0A7H1BH97_9ACTN|nr:GNAT family protein [Streptomyces xanthii]QNS08102.1 GNAT family N-acetyltransferase [Streptomyces xanthii]
MSDLHAVPYLVHGPRVAIRTLHLADHTELAALARESAVTMRRWLGVGERTEAEFAAYIEQIAQPSREGYAICRSDTGAIVGTVNINNIVRGGLQCGTLGYTAYASTTGRGYMTEGLRLVVRYAFEHLDLHRLEANIQPDNEASLNLVRRLGFRREGFSPAFQRINGEWRDHERWALTRD